METIAARMQKTIVAIAGAAVLLVAGVCAAQETLSVGGLSGGIWAESFRNGLITPFGQQFKVQTKSEEGISAVVLAKLRQQKGNPQFDVVFMDRGVSDLAIREGLVEPISASVQTSSPDVIPEAFIKNSKGEITAVALTYWGAGLAYNEKQIKDPPASWLDLKSPAYKGKLAVYSPENSIAIPMLVVLSQLQGGSPSNMDPAFNMMKSLSQEGTVFFAGSPAGANLLANGEAQVAVLASTNVWELQAKGLPIKFVVPKEGVIGQDIRMHVVTGTKNKALAEKFVAYAISKTPQEEISKRLYTAPVNTKVQLAPDVDAKLPWGPHGSIKNLRLVDGNVILDNREAWIARWNKEVAK
jgi:putative spermidine/putrescine transport system substrate-binding protein